MANLDPFFTLCIPVYNSGLLCKTAINSAINQKFKDFEILIIDDQSNDGTWEIVQQFSTYPKVKIFRNEENLGMTKNWNKCLELANGKYIGFVHHDDMVTEDFLNDAFELLTKNQNIGIVSFLNTKLKKRPIMGEISAEKYFNFIFSMVHVPPPSETIIKNLKLVFNEKMVYCPETDLYLQITKLQYSAFHSSKSNVLRNPTNWSGNVTSKTYLRFDRFKDNLFIIKKWQLDPWNNIEKVRKSLKIITKELLLRHFLGKFKGGKSNVNLINLYLNEVRKNDFFTISKINITKLIASILPSVTIKLAKTIIKNNLLKF